MSNKSTRVAVVIPSVREVELAQLDRLSGADVLIVDGGGFHASEEVAERVHVLTQAWQRATFGADFYLIGHGAAACRNAGVWYAHQRGYDVIINLDDDCWPESAHFVRDVAALLTEPREMTVLAHKSGWVSTLQRDGGRGEPWYPRGFPYEARLTYGKQTRLPPVGQVQPVAHVGLWTGAIDFNAVDKLSYDSEAVSQQLSHRLYATHDFVPVCAMNYAVTREYAPFMYQIPWASWGETCLLARYDDIIGGLFTCALASLCNEYVSFGPPFVEHRKKDLDLLKHAAQENLGNVLVSQFAALLKHAMRCTRIGAYMSPRARMFALFAELDALAWGTDLWPVVTHCTSTYRRWLPYFAEEGAEEAS